MTIIGFGHKKRTGKDTAVRFCMSFARQFFPSICVGEISFGNQLKRVSKQMFGWAGLEDALYYNNNAEHIERVLTQVGLTPRQIWDKVGLMGREIFPRIWVEMAAMDVESEAQVLFSKDVRFPTEIELIERFHGSIYRIDRSCLPSGGVVDQALNDFNGWTGIINNNNDLRSLNMEMKKLVCKHFNPLVTIDKRICPNCFASRSSNFAANGSHECIHCKKEYNVNLA